MLLFKVMGLLLIILASTLLGFYKSNILKKRAVKLCDICISLSNLSQLVKSCAGELEALFSLSFDNNILNLQAKKQVINKNYLETKDIELLENFFAEVGMSDSETEYKRIEVFKALLQKQAAEAEKKSAELSKLYNSLGFLIGLSICIFLV